MRIALRTGGGRGVYELAGRQGQTSSSDLFGRQIFYELTPSIVIPGRATASRLQGKPRIRLDDNQRQKTTHFYRLLAAVLLLPKPKRELRTTHGDQLLGFEAYSMSAIKVDVGETDQHKVVLRPTDLLLENADNLNMNIEFAQRMARITRLWGVASQQDTPIAKLIRNLQQAVQSPDPNYKTIEGCAQSISKALRTEGDPLPLAEQQLGLEGEQQNPPQLTPLAQQVGFGIEDDVSPQEARIQRVKQWRQQAVRGYAGGRFRKEVSDSYDYRCILSGQRLPRIEITESAGVDSAHILPWSTHDINSVRNGLCLTKQCHWAFDEGILRLAFDRGSNMYLVELPRRVRQAALRESFDLGYFESLTGPIPSSRLPRNQALWPSPTYIEELNRFMFGN